MAFDGIFLKAVVHELNTLSSGAKVDKIYQPERDEIVLSLRCFGENRRLLLSAGANHARLHFTEISKENPASPPMFCMLLRKHLLGAKLLSVTQEGFERIAVLTFECYNDFGDLTIKRLHTEIMGRHSNIIFTDEQGKIIDSVKHIDLTVSSQRQVLPGLTYRLPPPQEKLLLSESAEYDSILSAHSGRLDKCLLSSIAGFSPLVSREISYTVTGKTETEVSELTPSQKEKLTFTLKSLAKKIVHNEFEPIMLLNSADKSPFEFSFFDINQYGASALTVKAESFSTLLDSFFKKREKAERMKQRSGDILKLLSNAEERVVKKLNLQKAELEDSSKCEEYKKYGDLLNANLYRLEKSKVAVVEDFYNDSTAVKIPLDPTLTPSQNAQKYYKEYRKRLNSAEYLKAEIQKGIEEYAYLESVFDGLSKVETESELSDIREELALNGYIRRMKIGKERRTIKAHTLMEFVTSDGFTVTAGKNNLQNDTLTLKLSQKTDLWFHIKDFAGSHTVIKTEGKEVPQQSIIEAASIAAFYSRAKASSNAAVDYTLIKHVKKPSGAKPGMVIYVNNKTVYVTPSEELAERLRKK